MKYTTQNKKEIEIVNPADIVSGVDAMLKYAQMIDIVAASIGVNTAIIKIYREVIQDIYSSLNIELPELNFTDTKLFTEKFFTEWQNFFQVSVLEKEEKTAQTETQETEQEAPQN